MKKNFLYSEKFSENEELFYEDKNFDSWVDKPKNIKSYIKLDLGADTKSQFNMYINKRNLQDLSLEDLKEDRYYYNEHENSGTLEFMFRDECEVIDLNENIIKMNLMQFKKLYGDEFGNMLELLLEVS